VGRGPALNTDRGAEAPTRLLLVEDDARIRQALRMALADEGCEVVEAPDGESALAALAGTPVDVVLLDLMLPGVGGLEVCRTLRARGDLPIIIVSARADHRDVIAGLEAGADDYVTKPLVAAVLAARIRALLRRRAPGTTGVATVVRAGDLEIRPEEQVVLRDSRPVHLTRTEFGLLRRVWGYDYVADTRLLDVHVRRLRRKVEDDPDDPRCVLTVRGSGYKIGQTG
jgi:two-component system response regulator MtrA